MSGKGSERASGKTICTISLSSTTVWWSCYWAEYRTRILLGFISTRKTRNRGNGTAPHVDGEYRIHRGKGHFASHRSRTYVAYLHRKLFAYQPSLHGVNASETPLFHNNDAADRGMLATWVPPSARLQDVTLPQLQLIVPSRRPSSHPRLHSSPHPQHPHSSNSPSPQPHTRRSNPPPPPSPHQTRPNHL